MHINHGSASIMENAGDASFSREADRLNLNFTSVVLSWVFDVDSVGRGL